MNHTPPDSDSHRRASLRVGLLVLTAAGLAMLPSCAGGRKPVYSVNGQVLVNGKPAAGATVVFHPVGATTSDTLRPAAQVDAQGAFKLTTYAKDDGAPEGDYVVTVEWRPEKKTPFDPPPADRLNGRYGNTQVSPLRAHVERLPNDLEPFRLQYSR
jgi:hypothetical protein